MATPTSIADLKTQKATQVDLLTDDVESARRSQVVLLNLIDNQSARAIEGVDSFVLFDEEDHGIEDTKTDGTEQSNLKGGVVPTTLAIDKFRTVPGYFYYKLGEHSRINWIANFVNSAPGVAILDVERAAIAALRAIGATAGHYVQMTGTNLAGTANSVPSLADYKAALKILITDKKLNSAGLRSIGSQIDSVELPAIFGAYDPAASGALGDLAKTKGFIREVLGVPHYASQEIEEKEHIIFHEKAVSYAIRNMANLTFEGQASKSRDYYGVAISYGVVARQDKRAVVMQSGATYTP
jgi:hypothetical protein